MLSPLLLHCLLRVAAGDLMPSVAGDIGKLIDSYLRSNDATAFEQRLAKIEKRITMKSSSRHRLVSEEEGRVALQKRPFIFANLKSGERADQIARFIIERAD